MKKIFLTGGAGYVGIELTDELIRLGYHVTVLDLMLFGNNFSNINHNLKIIKGDIRDKNLLENIIPDHEVIIHLACISNDPSFDLNPELGKSINLNSFEPFVKISKKLGVKRFIFASSSSVYGVKKEKNVTEDIILEPLTDYSKYKAACEKILFNYMDKDFTTTVIRPATVCGYSKRQRLDVVVNILTNLAYHKKQISVFGGNQLRPNIHIKDMIQVYVNLIKADKNLIQGETFNVGYENQTVNELSKIVKSIIGDDVDIIKKPSDDNRSYHISSKKIYDVLGFKTKFKIEDAVLDLKEAFDKKLLVDTLSNKNYFNIKKMQSLNLT